MRKPKLNLKRLLLCSAAITGVFLAQLNYGQDANSDAQENSKKPEAETSEQQSITDNNASTNAPTADEHRNEWDSRNWSGPVISIGKDVELKEGQTAEAMVVIGGNAKVRGKVHAAVVVIGGDIELTGEVGDAVVAILGNLTARSGAKVHGDAVSVGGKIDVESGANVERTTQPIQLPNMRWLGKYFTHCVLLMRPLAPEVGWIWIVAGIWFLFYLLVAALFPAPVAACVAELRRRPVSTFFMGVLAKLILPLALLILGITGLGLVVIPFLLAALVLGAIIGRIALAEWIGFKLGGNIRGNFSHPLLALILGALIIAILYMVPIVGFFTMLIVSAWGLGCAVTAAFGGLRREAPPKQPAIPQPVASAPAPNPVTMAPGAQSFAAPGSFESGAAGTATAPGAGFGSPAAAVAGAPQPPLVPEVFSFPRASFWERIGAGFLDLILVGILSSFVGRMPLPLLVALVYFAGMWMWKGTTVGGIVLGLKVVRLDGNKVTVPVALVRALAAGFSVVVLFLGFIWIAWDREKQGWHDRIAGTVVLRLPRGTPLLCF